MKNIIIVSFLFLSSNLFSQIKTFETKIKDKKLLNVFQTENKLFDAVDNFLIKELNTDNASLNNTSLNVDSLSYSDLNKLVDLYMNIKKSKPDFYLKGFKKETEELVSEYYSIRLNRIDSLYKLYRADKINTYKSIRTKNSEKLTNTDAVTGIIVPPSHESCKNSEVDSKNCFMEVLNKKVRNYINIPEYRTLNIPQAKLILKIDINKEGQIQANTIAKSSGYFEFDMEAALSLRSINSNNKFTPAYQDKKPIYTTYMIPIVMVIIE